MTDREMVLLRTAVEHLGIDFLTVSDAHAQWPARVGLTHGKVHEADTLAEALTAHLNFKKIDVPKFPSEERVAEIKATLVDGDRDTTDLPLPEYLSLRGDS